MKLRFLVAAIMLLAAIVSVGAYSDYSFTATAKINADGTASVIEKTIIYFENKDERIAFETKMNLGKSTIVDWKGFSDKIKFHFGGLITEQRITAKKEFTIGTNYGAIIIEYNAGTPIMQIEKTGSRKFIYTLNQKSLLFDQTQTGDMVLGNAMLLTFEIPKDATIDKVAPEPDSKDNSRISWNGPVARRWELVYERELPLSEEVGQFFSETYQEIADSLPLALVLGFSVLLVFVLAKFGKNK